MRGARHEAVGMIRKRKPAAPKRDYDRRKKRVNPRKTGRPIWRQPMALGTVVLLMGCGGAGGWWAAGDDRRVRAGAGG